MVSFAAFFFILRFKLTKGLTANLGTVASGSGNRSAPAQKRGPGQGQFVNCQAPERQTQPARPPIQRSRWLITTDWNIAQAEVNLLWHQARQACEGSLRSVGKQILQRQLTQSQQPTTACDLEHAPLRVRTQTGSNLAIVLEGKVSRPLQTRRAAWPSGGRIHLVTFSRVRILTTPLSFQWACLASAPMTLGTWTSRFWNS